MIKVKVIGLIGCLDSCNTFIDTKITSRQSLIDGRGNNPYVKEFVVEAYGEVSLQEATVLMKAKFFDEGYDCGNFIWHIFTE